MVYRIIRSTFKGNEQSADGTRLYIHLLFNLGLVTVYLLILCSGVNYMSRIEASWNIIWLTLMGIADFVKSIPSARPFLIPALIAGMALAFYPDGRFLICQPEMWIRPPAKIRENI